MEFYEWLHDVTTLGYDENIMIPTEKVDIIKNLYELNYTPKEAISAYKDLISPLPEAQPLEGVKTAIEQVIAVANETMPKEFFSAQECYLKGVEFGYKHAQFATDAVAGEEQLLTDCQEMLMNLIALNHVPDEVCPGMNDMISRIDDALAAPSTHSSSERVDLNEGSRRKAYQIFLNIWGEAANGSNYDIHQWAEFHNLLNKIIDNKPFKKVL